MLQVAAGENADISVERKIALPLVSVIIPAYNYGNVIGAAIDSLKAQTYLDWECLVVDDGSVDSTASIIQKYAHEDHRIRYFEQKNGGPSRARNLGLANARGSYIQFLDADDLLERRKLECHVKYLSDNPSVDLVYSEARYFRTEVPAERRFSMMESDAEWMPKISGSGAGLCKALIESNIMVVSAPLIRKRVIDFIGGFDVKLPPLEDWDYWLRCALNGITFHYLDAAETHSLIRLHSGSLSQNKLKVISQLDELRKKLSKTVNVPGLLEINRKIDFFSHSQRGIAYVNDGQLSKGIKHLFAASVRCAGWQESGKWAFSAMVAPLVPQGKIEEIVYSPIKEVLFRLLLGR